MGEGKEGASYIMNDIQREKLIHIATQWVSYPDLVQLGISLDDAEVDVGDDSHEDDSDKDEADVEGVDADEDVDEDADEDFDEDIDEGKSEAIHELPTLNPLSNLHPASSPFWL